MSTASLYLLLWTLGCAAGFVAALLVLRRHGTLGPATALAIGIAWAFLFVGSKWHSRLELLPWTEAVLVSPSELFAPGRRLPLGLLTSGAAAALCCVVLRLPWRTVGDALAVFWSALIPIGRIGCMIHGCCLGTVCPAWLRPLGWRYGPGSEAFQLQVAAGALSPTSPLSLPVHPLPLYFALASLATLALLLWLLGRGAPPGTLLLAFCILRPAAKLGLEPLRADPAQPWLMVAIPAATLASAAIAGAVVLFRRLSPAALVPLLVVTLAAPVARAETPDWSESLRHYAQNPLRNRRLLRRLEREGRGDHPPVVLLALADARLRAGSFTAAARLFARARAAEEPFATWAALGGAWASLLGGDEPEPVAGGADPVTAVVAALVDAAGGRADVALERLARVTDDGGTPPELRAVALLAAACTRHWARTDDAATITAFDAAVAAGDADLVDDAAYGAAHVRLRAGHIDVALPMLRDLAAWHVNGRPGAASPALVALDRDAMLRAGFERYRRGAVRTPERQLRAMLDGDGVALARAALGGLGEPVAMPRPTPRPQASPAATRAVATRPRTPGPQQSAPRSHPSLGDVAAWLRPVLLGAATLVVLLLVHGWWWDRRLPPGGRHGSRIS